MIMNVTLEINWKIKKLRVYADWVPYGFVRKLNQVEIWVYETPRPKKEVWCFGML